MEIRELTSIELMLKQLPILQEVYPSLTLDEYQKELEQMLPNNRYGQVAVFENEHCLGLSGYWIGHKLWCGKYLEIDNLVVSAKFRSKGVGNLLFEYLTAKAKLEGCSMLALDSYTSNFKAHKFFYNQGYVPKGFHFVHLLEESMLR